MTSSSRGKRPTTAWRADSRLGLALAWAALLCLPAGALAAEQQGGETCVRVAKQEAAGEGPGLRVRGEVTNTCPYVVRNVRVLVELRDKDGQVVGSGDGFVDPAVLGVQEAARFDVPAPATAAHATISVTASWRGVGRY